MFLAKLFNVLKTYNDLQKQVEILEHSVDDLRHQKAIVDPDPYCCDKAMELAGKALEKAHQIEHELKYSDKDLSLIYSELQNSKLQKIVIDNSEVKNGDIFSLEIHLEKECELSNVSILLESDNPNFVLPNYLTIPKNEKYKVFDLKCNSLETNVHVTISATFNNITKLEMIHIIP